MKTTNINYIGSFCMLFIWIYVLNYVDNKNNEYNINNENKI